MQTLEKTLRNKLERTVMVARDVAEAAACAAVDYAVVVWYNALSA